MTSLISNPRADKRNAHCFAEVVSDLLRKYPAKEEVVSDNNILQARVIGKPALLAGLAVKQVPLWQGQHKTEMPSVTRRVCLKK